MERDFRGYSLVQYSTFLGFLVCSDPKPSHLIILFLHFLGPRRQDTDFVFVLQSVRTSASCPSKRLLSASKTVKTCRSTWPFLNFLFLFDWTERISRGTHSELPLIKWNLNVFLKYLTPSVALRDSRSSSPLYISASPTSRLFSAGPTFCFFEHCKVQPVFDQLLVFKPGCWPIKRISVGNFVVIPLPAVSCNVASAWYAPINVSFDFFVLWWKVTKIFLTITHRWDCWSPQAIPTRAGSCSRQNPLLLPDTIDTRQEPIKLQEFFLSWTVSDNEVKKIWWLQG